MTKSIKVHLGITLLLVFFLNSSHASEKCHSRVISGFDADMFFQEPAKIVESFQKSPFNTIATTIAWSVVEAKKGEINLNPYYPRFDALTKAGYCLIIILDTSGRSMRSDVTKIQTKDRNSIPRLSIPEWIDEYAPRSNSVDFFGGSSPTLDFEDHVSLRLVIDLYKSVLPQLRQRYGKKIVGVAPCITNECEIKYTQFGFKWQSYSQKSQQSFKNYLINKGLPPANMPMMSYGNHLENGNPRPQPLYPILQEFREKSLRNYACLLAQEIRRTGLQSIGYFGQTFSFADGIYATGVIEQAVECFDIAAIDYNFYNGYDVEFKPEIPQFLAEYALTLGYKKVMIGLYMERFRDPVTLKIDPRGYQILKSSLQKISGNSRILGLEIGNLTGDEYKNIPYLNQISKAIQTKNSNQKSKQAAIYTSITNSYLWQGDWSNQRQVIQDNILATYNALHAMKDFRTYILTDSHARKHPESLSSYDLIILPHATTMPADVREAIINYLQLGGKMLVDMRIDEYKPDGSQQTDSRLRNLLGIGASQAFDRISLNSGIELNKQPQYITGFTLAPISGFKIDEPKLGGKGEGLVLQGKKTSTFGFMPLLVEGNASHWAKQKFESEVRRLISQE